MAQPSILDAEAQSYMEAIALQVRLLLYQEGHPGSLKIRRDASGRVRVEIEYDVDGEKISIHGGVMDAGCVLVQLGLKFHRLEGVAVG